jgi:hypothetical protein
LGKDLVEVPSSVQYANDLGGSIVNTIEDDMRTCRHRSQTWPHFIASATGKWMLFEEDAYFADTAHNAIRSVPTPSLDVKVPDF